ncbi:SDR family oxidoreductase [Ottowia sp.]|jgi:NAD(P)-dependent dehydrogenase (short-subunit alcohol dehydrogenase family)|uniref:SDR family NAD(P)-dependent oxidoreductase n=1 Tax=Ottowia sp. TaxID=1898956 RepID=UPI0025D784D3|nr:SDR family oxidoreductase [Ottowia sp.]MBK6615965.1 SDR family oxidoreductase [Ottowia sp.]MBK6747087.1 SDR family oxidoreductase [Ottowia sp.]
MHIDLTSKTALVTGSTLGIGLATAKALAGSGAAVIVNGRTQQAVDQAVAAVRAAAPSATVQGFAADLGTAEGCAALVAAHPAVDVLVNNLGIYAPQDFFEAPDEVWQRHFDVNVMSGVRLARAYMPGMVARGWGRVVFVASESGFNIPPNMVHYGMSKTAQIAIARGLAKRVAGSGVTVNSVLPGPTLSEGVAEVLAPAVRKTGQSIDEVGTAFVRRQRPSSIIGRLATVDEVAAMIVYACSPQASATTGAALRVDGGVVDSL